MRIKDSLKKISRVLNPMPPVGGLAISDTSIRFLLLKNEGAKPFSASLRLTPGLIADGKIKDLVNFKAALKKLREQIPRPKRLIHVVLTLPPETVYIQTFFVPLLAESRLEETAKLNLQMISPIDFNLAYSGYEKIGERFSEGGELELLGAFVEAKLVDDYLKVLEEAKFSVSAVEFPALSVVRLVSREPEVKATESYLLIQVADEGLALMIMKNLNLYFHHFHTWATIAEESGGKNVSPTDFKNFLTAEVQKVMNFYSSRWGGTFNKVILASSALNPELTKALESNFSLKVSALLETKGFKGIEPAWFATLGSALRGLMPRSLDNAISLTKAPVKIQYWQSRVLHFVGFWQKTAFSLLTLILVSFLGANFFLRTEEKKFQTLISQTEVRKELVQVQELQKRAEDFNRLVNFTLEAKKETIDWSKFFKELEIIAGAPITIKRIAASRSRVLVGGSAVDEKELLAFKNKLIAAENFEAVSLPLTEIKPNADGSVEFNLTFKLKSLTF